MSSASTDEENHLALAAALRSIREVLMQGAVVHELPDDLRGDAQLQNLVDYLTTLQQFTRAVARGDLSPPLRVQGYMAGSLKDLQASLRHLTWQTQMIAQGDFSQRVDFMGDFSDAFNRMTAGLAATREELRQREIELSDMNQSLINEIVRRRQVEQQLREANDQLARQLEELELRNEDLEAFAHTVAHDLKNPLQYIIACAERLTDPEAANHPHRSEWATYLLRGGWTMDSIISELLLLAEARRMDVGLEPVDMSAVVSVALQRLAGMIDEHGAIIRRPSPDRWPVALGYAPWVVEVWVNYLSNAIKYGGTPPEIEVGGVEEPDGAARFWVRDNGIGISADDQELLFRPFTQLGQVRRVQGHGLGLSIVHRIVTRQGGQVGVQSRADEGSEFYFRLPRPSSTVLPAA